MGRPPIVIAAVTLLLLAPLVAAAQGLGDASKKEKERREQTKAPKAKTYTQDDVAKLPPAANEPATSTGESTPPAASEEPTSPEQSAGAGESARRSDEKLWRERVAQATARVERARRNHETLAGLNLVPGYEYQDEKGRTVIASVEQLQRMTAAAKAELDAAEEDLAHVMEVARRSGIPPGWLR